MTRKRKPGPSAPASGARRAAKGPAPVRVTGELKAGKREGRWCVFSEAGKLVRECTYKKGVLHGPFVAYHPNGKVAEQGTYVDERRHGVWQVNYPSGVMKERATYRKGLRHGASLQGFASGQISHRASYREDALDGLDREFHQNGRLKRERTWVAIPALHEWRHSQEGVDRIFFEDGTLSLERPMARGKFHGKQVSKNEDGSPELECDYVFGVKHGVETIWKDGEPKTTRYVCGVPEDKLGKKALRALAAKLKKKDKDKYEKMEWLGELTDDESGASVRLLWHMIREGLVEPASLEDLWDDLADDEAVTGKDVVAFLSSLKAFKDWGYFLTIWPTDLDKLVCEVYARDPAPIDAAVARLPGLVRDGVRTVRARFGHDERKLFDADMAAVLAESHAKQGIGSTSVGVHGSLRTIPWKRDGVLQEVCLSPDTDSDIPNELFYELVELFTTRDAYARAMLEVCLASEEPLSAWRIVDALRIATTAQFGKLLTAGVIRDDDLVVVLTEIRGDREPPEKLLEWARQVGGFVAETLAVVAATRFIAARQPVPEAADAFLGQGACLKEGEVPWRALEHAWHRSQHYTGRWTEASLETLLADMRFGDAGRLLPQPFGMYRALLAKLPRPRALAIVTRMLQPDAHCCNPHVVALAADLLTPELWKLIVAFVERRKPSVYSDADAIALGIAALPATALPWIRTAWQKAPKPTRDFWHRAMLYALAAAAGRGETWSVEHDDALHFGPFGKDDERCFNGHYEHALRVILAALPLERARPVFDRGFAAKPAIALRTFVAIASHPVDEVLRPAFELLLPDKLKLDDEAQVWIPMALAGLREDGTSWARWVFDHRTKRHQDLESCLYAALGEAFWEAQQAKDEGADFEHEPRANDDDDRLTELGALLDSLPARQRRAVIYALRRGEVANGCNRIGGVPPGVDAKTWPMNKDGEPMQFVCMLDLDSVPEVKKQRKLGKARALALFISSAMHHHADEPYNADVRVVQITGAALGKPSTPPPGAKLLDQAGFTVTRLEVPEVIFEYDFNQGADESEDSSDLDDTLRTIRDKVYQLHARAGAFPIWVQDGQSAADFVLQLDEAFVPELNLGDAGVLYWFADTAFSQCH